MFGEFKSLESGQCENTWVRRIEIEQRGKDKCLSYSASRTFVDRNVTMNRHLPCSGTVAHWPATCNDIVPVWERIYPRTNLEVPRKTMSTIPRPVGNCADFTRHFLQILPAHGSCQCRSNISFLDS